MKKQTEDIDKLIEDEGEDLNFYVTLNWMIVKNLQYNMPIVELQKKCMDKFIRFIQMIDQVIHDKTFENKLVIEENNIK